MKEQTKEERLAKIEAERLDFISDHPDWVTNIQTIYVVKTDDLYPHVEAGEYYAKFEFSYQARVEMDQDDFIYETQVEFDSLLDWGEEVSWTTEQCRKFIPYGKRKMKEAKTDLLRNTYKGWVEMAEKAVEIDGELFLDTTY